MSFEAFCGAVLWSAATIGLYALARAIYRRWPRWWTGPLAVTPALLLLMMAALHETYHAYITSTQWLIALLGPATVSFAVPIYEQRAMIRANWPLLLIGVVAGTVSSMVSAWVLATLLGLDQTLRLSLLPRSISTPFAMTVAGDVGGVPVLTAVFVVLTGLLGAGIGEALLGVLPLRSALARGTLFGAGAHGIGVTKAHEVGRSEGSVAGLMLVLIGVSNVLLAPLLAHLLALVKGD